MNCIICGEKTKIIGQIKRKKIYRCDNCGFGQTENLKVQRNQYHRDETYIIEERLFKNIFIKRVNIICKFRKSGKALEIGCSTGLMLSILKNRGWEVTGIEMSKKASEVARSKGLDVRKADFMEVNLDKTFDLIIFNHTLEHLKSPKDVLQKAYQLLNKKGVLYIDVPNFGGLTANLLRINWPLLLPEEHLWHFTFKSLDILLKNLRLKIIFVERSSGIWDYSNPSLGLFQSLFSFKKRFFKEIVTAIPSLIVSKLRVGSDLMVLARKN